MDLRETIPLQQQVSFTLPSFEFTFVLHGYESDYVFDVRKILYIGSTSNFMYQKRRYYIDVQHLRDYQSENTALRDQNLINQ